MFKVMVPVTSGQTSIYTSIKVLAHHDSAHIYIHSQPCTSIYRPFMGLRRHRSTFKTSHPYMCFSCKNKKNGSKKYFNQLLDGQAPKKLVKKHSSCFLNNYPFFYAFFFNIFCYFLFLPPLKSVRADQYCRPALEASCRLRKVPVLYYTRASTAL